MKSIKEWQKELHKQIKENGLLDHEPSIPEMLCGIHSEVSEAFEAYRNNDRDNFKEELADIAIRLFGLAGIEHIDLEKQIERKHDINKKRPYRHGGKKC